MEQAIVRNPEIMHGTPVFRGTRVPVQTLFDYLEGGETLEDFLKGFPTVTRNLAFRRSKRRSSSFCRAPDAPPYRRVH
jgi:hypothetical protein